MSANLTLNAKNHARQGSAGARRLGNCLGCPGGQIRAPFFAGADKSAGESREKPPRLGGRDQADGRRQ